MATSTFATDDLEVLRDTNPQHIDAEFAASTRFHGVIAQGMWSAAQISAGLGTRSGGRLAPRRSPQG